MIRRLERIDALEREGANPRTILAEVRELLREGEAWVASEGPSGSNGAAEALERARRAYGAQAVSVT